MKRIYILLTVLFAGIACQKLRMNFDLTPPGNVLSFAATSGDNQIMLTWKNPVEADFAGVKILRKTGGFPEHADDGFVVHNAAGTSTVDTGLTNGTEYYYTAFAFDANANVTRAGVQKKAVPILGSWYAFLGGTGGESGYSVIQTSDGGYVLSGFTSANIPTLGGQTPLNAYAAGNDMLVIKITAFASVAWYTFLGGAGNEQGQSLVQASDGGYVLLGRAEANIANLGGQTPLNAYGAGTDFLAVKLTVAGAVSWYTFLGGAGNDYASSVAQTIDGGYILLGQTNANIANLGGQTPINAYNASDDMLAVKITPAGSVSWYTFLGGAGTDGGYSVAPSSDGGCIVLGNASANIANLGGQTPLNAYNASDDMLAVKLSTLGSVTWYTFLGGTASDQGTGVAQTSDGGYILSGYASANIASLGGQTPVTAYSAGADFLAVKLTAAGSVSWYTFLGGGANDYANAIAQTSDGGYILLGNAGGNIANLGGQTSLNAYNAIFDWLAVKLTSTGTVSWYTFLGSATTDNGSAVASTSDGGYILLGDAAANIASLGGQTPKYPYSTSNDFLVVKLKSNGGF